MFLASDPTLFRVGEGGIVFYAEQYLEMRRYVYIISLSKNLLSLIVGDRSLWNLGMHAETWSKSIYTLEIA